MKNVGGGTTGFTVSTIFDFWRRETRSSFVAKDGFSLEHISATH